MNKKRIFLGCLLISFLFFTENAVSQSVQSEVVVESLPELSPNVIGTLPTSNPFLWSHTPIKELEQLFQKLEKTSLLPAQQQLITHLMTLDITGTTFNDSQNKLKTNQFLLYRLNVLKSLGEWDELLKLLQLLPEQEYTAEIENIKMIALLLKGETKAACDLLDTLESNLETDKWRISCFLAKEEKEKALLSYDILQDTYSDNLTQFSQIADNALREIPTEILKDVVIQPEEIYLFSLVKKIDINWDKQSRVVKKTLVELPTTDILLRIELGEKLGLNIDELKRLYRLPLFNPDLKNPVIQRVLTYKKITETTNAVEKAQLLKSWIELIKRDNLFVFLSPLVSDIVNTMEVSDELIDIAFDAVQVYVLENNASMAEPWYRLLKESDNPLHQKQYLLATPLMHTLGSGYPYDMAERMFRLCKTDKIACDKLKMFLPSEVYDIDENFNTDISHNIDLKTEIDMAQLGEKLIKAILHIQEQIHLPESYQFIKEYARPDVGSAILREGMIF